MRSSLAHCALVVMTVIGLSGCKSGGGIGMPKLSNPFAKSSASDAQLPTANATPTPPAGYAAANARTTAPPFAGSATTTGNLDTAGSLAGRSGGAAPTVDYGTAASTSSTGGSYMAPQVGRYATAGGYGTPSASPSYNRAPPLTASRSSAAPGYSLPNRDYSSAEPSSRYANQATSGLPRYGEGSDSTATKSADPLDSYRNRSYLSDSPASDRLDRSYGADSGSRAPEARVSAADSGYRIGSNRPWNRTGQAASTSDSGGRFPETTPSTPRGYTASDRGTAVGDTGYTPGQTGYTPGVTGYNPPNTAGYQSPAPAYKSPLDTAGSSDYSPGSTGRWSSPTASYSDSNGTATDDARSRYPSADTGVSPAGFSQPSTGTLR